MSTPATTNPLGVKGTGEAGTTAAIAAVMNAVANAIPNGAADHMEMPATRGKIWEACQKGMAYVADTSTIRPRPARRSPGARSDRSRNVGRCECSAPAR